MLEDNCGLSLCEILWLVRAESRIVYLSKLFQPNPSCYDFKWSVGCLFEIISHKILLFFVSLPAGWRRQSMQWWMLSSSRNTSSELGWFWSIYIFQHHLIKWGTIHQWCSYWEQEEDSSVSRTVVGTGPLDLILNDVGRFERRRRRRRRRRRHDRLSLV